MAATSEQIQAWAAANPNATPEQIQQVMQANGVTAVDVAQAMPTAHANAPADVAKTTSDYAKYQEGMKQYNAAVKNNPMWSDANTGLMMNRLGITPEMMNQFGGVDLAKAQGLSEAAKIGQAANTVKGKVTDEQVKTYIAGNPNMSPDEVYAAMQKWGVTPEQFGSVMGIPTSQVIKNTANSIPTGVAGYEDAMNKGLTDATGTLRGAETSSRSDLTDAQAKVAALYGLNVADIQSAGDKARVDIQNTFKTAGDYYAPYQQAGTNALGLQQALAGASGQDAFNAAYQESPYIAFLREQGMRSNLAGSAATGGLGGGNVQKELNRFGQGLASQGLQTQIGNLQNLSSQGLNAAQGAAGVQTGMGTNLANIGTSTAGDVAAQRGALAGSTSTYGANMANIGQTTGTNVANLQAQTASGIANTRSAAGTAIANNLSAAATSLGNLANQQGTNAATQIQNQTGAVQGINAANATNQQNYTTGLADAQANAVNGQQLAQAPAMNWGTALGGALQTGGAAVNLMDMYNKNNAPAATTYKYANNLPSYMQPSNATSSGTNNIGNNYGLIKNNT
jgi:DNA-binding transcriptional regulator YiaG